MDNLVMVLDPTEQQAWLVAVGTFYAASYFSIWLLALILSRLTIFGKTRPSIALYFAWSLPLTIHTVLCAILLLWSAKYYRDLSLSLGYSVAFFIPLLISGILAIKSIRRLQERVIQAENEEVIAK